VGKKCEPFICFRFKLAEVNVVKSLCKKVKALEGESSSETVAFELPQHLKQNIIDEILQRLRGLNSSSADIAKERGECMLVNFVDTNPIYTTSVGINVVEHNAFFVLNLITLVIKYCVYILAKLTWDMICTLISCCLRRVLLQLAFGFSVMKLRFQSPYWTF